MYRIGNIIKKYLVAIYIRLSKEDANLGESESIQNQKILLQKYVEEQGYTLVDIYIDDGYTGTNFNRPGFQRMLKDIEDGKVNMVVTKDLSRLSRDYIGTGEYVEKWFPEHNIRYVALTDGVDTEEDNTNNDIAPFKAILNDMYAKDLSKKIRTALNTMKYEGKWVGGCIPFGYKADPKNKNHFVINKKEARIVKKIFNLYLSGCTIAEVMRKLNDDKEPTFSITRNRNLNRKKGGNIIGYWTTTSVKKKLTDEMYTGCLIQNKRSRISYKNRKLKPNPKEQWIIVENTHEAIISKEDFNKVQQLLPAQTKRNDKKTIFLLDGLLKCADCNSTIGIPNRKKHNSYRTYTVCNLYRRYPSNLKLCTSHSFNYDKLEEGIINVLKKMFKSIDVSKIKDSIKYLEDNSSIYNENKVNKLEYDISNLERQLDNMYMDKLSDKISEDMYNRIKLKIETDMNLKKEQINKLKNDLNNNQNEINDLKDLEDVVNNYLSLENPTRDLMLKLINKINIHEDGNIDIYFNFKELDIIKNLHFT